MMNDSLHHSFLHALEKSYRAYNTPGGARSSRKLMPVHSWFANRIATDLGNEFEVCALGMGGEKTVDGRYHPKRVDIATMHNDKTVSVLSLKMIMSNYKQNSINYFENLLGETANIRRTGIGFGHFLVLRGDTPYYTKNRGNLRGEEIRRESLSEKDLDKYIRLFADNDTFPHKPEVLGIAIVNFNEHGQASFCLADLDLPLSMKKTLENKLSLSVFLRRFSALCRLKQ